jgi:hypothetical protein
MRLGLMLALSVVAAVLLISHYQHLEQHEGEAFGPGPVPRRMAAEGMEAQTAGCSGNPNALGVARVVEIDASGGPGFGFEQYKAHDFLLMKEVVLTFDDGPWPSSTRAVLDALQQHCTRATFFPIGKHALLHPEILREVAQKGHTIGTHTWSHARLGKITPEKAKEEIEKGLSAVKLGPRGATGALLPLPVPAGSYGPARLSGDAQHRHLLARPRQLRLQVSHP